MVVFRLLYRRFSKREALQCVTLGIPDAGTSFAGIHLQVDMEQGIPVPFSLFLRPYICAMQYIFLGGKYGFYPDMQIRPVGMPFYVFMIAGAIFRWCVFVLRCKNTA